MSWKNIEISREVRLWITQILVPIVGVALVIPESREALKTRALKVKDKVQAILHK